MKTIQIADDVYSEILKSAKEIGEDASSILRRRLGIQQANAQPKKSVAEDPVLNALEDFIKNDHQFRFARGVAGRFTHLLAFLENIYHQQFDAVLKLGGRKRKYFAKSKQELEASGKSVNPKKIGTTEYWVITTTSTDQKDDILRDVMKAFDCSWLAINRACEALKGDF